MNVPFTGFTGHPLGVLLADLESAPVATACSKACTAELRAANLLSSGVAGSAAGCDLRLSAANKPLPGILILNHQ